MSTQNHSAGAHDLLRQATADLHQRVAQATDGYRLDTANDYGRFLVAQASALLPVESALEHAGIDRLVPGWSARRRSAAIAEDIADLGLIVCRLAAPRIGTPATVFGAAYVLENSRLGVQAVLRRAEKNKATRFLQHGQHLGLWPSFLAALEASDCVRRFPQDSVRAARDVFRLFLDAMAPADREKAA